MMYNFFNEKFSSLINGTDVNYGALEKYLENKEKGFILKHNEDAIAKIIQFLNSNEKVFLLNGFMGSGKTYVADCICDFVSDDVLLFKTSYQEAINLDDILLSLFKDFSKYHYQHKIVIPKIDSNVFSDKINAYIKACNAPMIFIFDSFEINMHSEDSQNDILDFINYLSRFEKIKILICSRTFKPQDLNSSITYMHSLLSSLIKEEMISFFEKNEITASENIFDEIYNVSRGHFLLIELSILIMNIFNFSLEVFYSEFKKSNKNFIEFLISKILSVSTERFLKLLIFMSLVRHGVSIDFIVNQKLASADDVDFLMQKLVVSEKYGNYYIKDYIKKEFIKTVNIETRIKMHKYLKEVYEAELPLKPFERQLFLSRITMRQEIAHHIGLIELLSAQIDKTSVMRTKDNQGISYLTYVRASGVKVDEEKNNSSKRYVDILKSKEKQKKTELSKDDILLFGSESKDALSEHFQSISTVVDNTGDDIGINIDGNLTSSVPDSLNEYLGIAKNCEKNFNFSDAILYYRRALTYDKDETFKQKEPLIYIKIANCYKKIQDIEQAVNVYEKVYQLYSQTSPDEANKVLMRIARMYSEVYKYDKSKEYYNRILAASGLTNDLKVKVYLDLADIENNENAQMAAKYIQTAITIAEKAVNSQLLAECYFKYALMADSADNIELALKCYQRSIQVCADPNINKNLSEAYSNLAAISFENKNINAAKMYYELSIDADIKQNNYDGLYYSYSKLSKIYKAEKSDKALTCLINALNCAKKLEDVALVVSSYIEIGDYHLVKNNFKESVKAYILARTMAFDDDEETISKIKNRLVKIKMALGDNKYNELLSEIKKK